MSENEKIEKTGADLEAAQAPAKPAKAADKKAAKAEKKDAKPGFFQRIARWFREMKSELKKVIWPTPQTLGKNVLISLGVMFASAIVLWGFDELATMLVNGLLTLAG